VIGARTGTTTRRLWERGGEDAYRGFERAAVLETLADPRPSVLAAPGGVVLDPEVRRALERPEVAVVWLRATLETLASRVVSGDHRPLLGENPSAVLGQLATLRHPVYAELADVVVDVDSLDPESVAERVLAGGKGYASVMTDEGIRETPTGATEDRELDEEGVPDLQGPLAGKVATGDPQEGMVHPNDRPRASVDYGTTAAEMRQPEPFDQRLQREQPDVDLETRPQREDGIAL
jgi:shikimate kinase